MCDACLHDECECYCGPLVVGETPQEPLEDAAPWYEDNGHMLEIIAKQAYPAGRMLVEGWSIFQRIDGKPLSGEDRQKALDIVGATYKRLVPINPYLIQVSWEIDSSG